jgi:hypothetical protein
MDETAQFADYHAQRELWVETVRSAQDRGKLETVPTSLATTKREKRTAQAQNYWLSKKSIGGFHPNYDRIDWSKR